MRIGDSVAERFVIERLARSGGMGDVYLAFDKQLRQPVAVKVLRNQHASDAARFEREARILSAINHPLVVRHVAHGALPSGDPYLVMEWLEGEDLAARLARGRLAIHESVALTITVAEALSALHDLGIVHRDLKPSNVFLVEGRLDRVKLLDFGIVQIGAETRITRSGLLVGTPAYMAPEQARGDSQLDPRADIFALGCLLYECLTGEPAFAAAHIMAVLTKILFDEPPRIRERLPRLPASLEASLARMLSKRVDDRPRDGRAAANALRALGEIRMGDASVEDATAEAPRPSRLTGSEQRAFALILISARPPSAGGSLTLSAAPSSSSATAVAALGDEAILAEAKAYGGHFERLLGGSAAVLLSGKTVATDLAARAARLALALRSLAGGCRLALAMGRGDLSGQLPMASAIDRAASLLAGGGSAGIDEPSAPVALDDAAVGLLDARFDVRQESGVHVLVAERDMAEARTLLGKPTPCVGRERELRTLQGFFETCIGEDGGARAALVTGPPGMGKSRIGRELMARLRARGEPLSVWIARGEPLRAGSAFGLLAGLVQSAVGLRSGEPVETRRQKLLARVAENVAEAEQRRVAEFLGELLGAAFPDEESLPLRAARRDAQLMSDQIRAAFQGFLAAECEQSPVLLMLEDLHWGDATTVQVLDRALGELEEKPLFVLALARPEVHEVFAGLWSGRLVQELKMRELPRKAAEQLARHVLGPQASAAMLERVVRLADGNAFYLEELIRAVAEGKGDNLPETVVAMVQSRLGLLSDDERRLLRAASIFGETFWTGAVAALAGDMELGKATLEARFAALAGKELIQKRSESRFSDEVEYAFRHALLREGAYAMLTQADCALGHRLAAAWLERRGEEDPVVLAEHFEKGGEGEKAAQQWLRAAERANRGVDSKGALTHVGRGLAMQVSEKTRLHLLGVFCEVASLGIEHIEAALPYAEELMRLSARGSGPWAQAALIQLTEAIYTGKKDQFGRLLRELAVVEIQPNAAEPAFLTFAAGLFMLDLMGQIAEANVFLDRLRTLTFENSEPKPAVEILWHLLVGIHSVVGSQDPWQGLAHSRIGLERAKTIGHRRYATIAQHLGMMNASLLGAHEEARRLRAEPSKIADEQGLASAIYPLSGAWLLADLGSFQEARESAQSLIIAGQIRRAALDEGRGHWALAEVLRRTGELDAADTAIQTALSILRMACPLDAPGALATLSALRLAQGKPAEALAAAEEGMALSEAMGGACSQFFRGAFLRLSHAEALHATGQHEAARAAIGEARDWVMSVAGKVGDPEYRTSYLENVPENRRIFELARAWLGEPS